ncbi:RrF2 family transcriptional regulator [Niabella soli]|uniref:Rrf2 family transcriptional regulator n=1 Tax=Niabella soli DSM 19437 TaxID=929713 RepID=W0F1T2_9BACT|nr:Rrf2 family transcriptional regulator [Niabella soli]AHF15281.1 Rrf2 family transcriptional regulator [Niabella soli DSM 19437]
MFSKTCEYAIRAMIFIAQQTRNGERVSIIEIANGIDSPEHFIAKILQELSRKKIVLSLKGPTGGFYHDEATLEHSLADIVTAVDGNAIFTGCGLGLRECSETQPCPLHNKFKKIRKGTHQMLTQAKLSTFVDQPKTARTFLKR